VHLRSQGDGHKEGKGACCCSRCVARLTAAQGLAKASDQAADRRAKIYLACSGGGMLWSLGVIVGHRRAVGGEMGCMGRTAAARGDAGTGDEVRGGCDR